MTNKRWIVLFAALLLLCAAALFLMPRAGSTVGVFQNGELVYTIHPHSAAKDYVLTYEAGETLVHAGPDGIWVESADCKNQNCVRHGPLKPGGTPIVCLPERIVVRYMADDTIDAVTG